MVPPSLSRIARARSHGKGQPHDVHAVVVWVVLVTRKPMPCMTAPVCVGTPAGAEAHGGRGEDRRHARQRMGKSGRGGGAKQPNHRSPPKCPPSEAHPQTSTCHRHRSPPFGTAPRRRLPPSASSTEGPPLPKREGGRKQDLLCPLLPHVCATEQKWNALCPRPLSLGLTAAVAVPRRPPNAPFEWDPRLPALWGPFETPFHTCDLNSQIH